MSDFEYHHVINKMFPTVFARKEIIQLVQKYNSKL